MINIYHVLASISIVKKKKKKKKKTVRGSKHERLPTGTDILVKQLNIVMNVYILRVSDQNGVSQAWYVAEIHHSGREPSLIISATGMEKHPS